MRCIVLKIAVLIVAVVFIDPMYVSAKRGCCSHHGGVAGCNSSGRQVCNDGTLSPTCTCTPAYIYGCTDLEAKNYNANANKDNGSCVYYKYGCTKKDSLNYDETAEKDDGSCVAIVYGCTDSKAKNYNDKANIDDDSCIYEETNVNIDEEENVSDKLIGLWAVSFFGTTGYLIFKNKR